jgi:hypothetical protein
MIQALARMKSYLDYGILTPIQIGAIKALRGPPACVAEPLSECLAASHVNFAARQRGRRNRSHSTSMGSPSLATLALCILRSSESSSGKAN